MNLLARARGLQEGIRRISSVSRFVHTFVDTAGNVRTTETLVIDEPAKQVLLVRHGSHRPARPQLNLLCLGEGDIDLPLPLVTK